jgi:hypothetical protein
MSTDTAPRRKPRTLALELVDSLGDRIRDGRLALGDKLLVGLLCLGALGLLSEFVLLPMILRDRK